ncbi:hypothetical protein [Mycoavidus sp. B2-EB]|uniref:hypothetical protein n=1 Tax=Mycoavidus sp. B2-EB TaxID=2651972 RepID=UPI0016233F07|nr:hypothetical protein [Mycoavidus sp. B2-EB]
MTKALFDTFKFVKRMQAAGVPSAQAEVLSEALVSNLQGLATKEDLNHAIGDVRKDIGILRKEVDFKIERSTFSVRQEMAAHKLSIVKWMIGLAIAQMGLIIGISNFFAMKLAG